MISDPDVPGYRYPEPGERYWHDPWARWVTATEGDGAPYDEVHVVDDRGQRAVVKLRSLYTQED